MLVSFGVKKVRSQTWHIRKIRNKEVNFAAEKKKFKIRKVSQEIRETGPDTAGSWNL